MRILALLVCFILFPAPRLFAGPVVFMEFLNSNFTFGTGSPNQEGYDLDVLSVDANSTALDFLFGGYEAQGAVFDHQTVTGFGGDIGSEYFYTGGMFQISIAFEKDGGVHTGSFVAPIKTLQVTAGEGDEDSALASYVLGPGIFETSLAEALGIGRHTRAGTAFSDLILTDHGNRGGVAGDHTTPERQAWDGVNFVELEVPEPATLALFAAGTAALSIRRRPRR